MPIDINAARAAKAAKKPAPAAADKPAKSTPAGRPSTDPGAVAELRTSGKLTEVSPNPLNPRRIDVESADMKELRADLKARGQMTPVPVVTADHYRRIFDGTPHAAKIGKADFVIVGGGRRHAALKANRHGTIKFTVLHGKEAPGSPADWLAATVAENIQREELSVMETARSVRDLRDYNTGREVAAIVNKSPGWVSQMLSLTTLPESVQAVIDSAPFSARQALSLKDYKTERAQLSAAQRIAAELLGLPSPSEPVKPEKTLPAEADDADDADQGDEPSGQKTGRKAHTPAQKLATTLGKNDRDTIIEALCLRFPAADLGALSAALIESEPVSHEDDNTEQATEPILVGDRAARDLAEVEINEE